MNLLDLIPGVSTAKLIAYGLGALAVVSAIGYGVHVYNDWIREPLETKLAALNDKIADQKRQAADRYAALEKERDEAAENWRKYAKSREDDFDSQMRDARARHDNSGMRFTDPAGRGCSGGSPETKAQGSTGVPANGTAESRVPNETGTLLSAEATQFLKDQALLADQAAIYAAAARNVALEALAQCSK